VAETETSETVSPVPSEPAPAPVPEKGIDGQTSGAAVVPDASKPVEETPPPRKPGVLDAIALVAAVVPRDEASAAAPDESGSLADNALPAAEVVADAPPPEAPAIEAKDAADAAPPAAASAEELSSPQAEGPSQSFVEQLHGLDPAEALKTAASSLLQAWGMALLADAPAGDGVRYIGEFASAYGFTVEPLTPSLTELEALNLPAFVRVGTGDKVFWLALLSLEEGNIRCSTGSGKTALVPREEFAKTYLAQAAVLWRDPAPDAEVLKPDMQGDQVRALQHRLRQLGRYEGELTGIYDAATTRAVSRLQSETALKQDGKAGRQVRMVLCSWLADFPTPALDKRGAVSPVQTASAPGSDDAAPGSDDAPSPPPETPSPSVETMQVKESETASGQELPAPADSGNTNAEAAVSETPSDAAPAPAPEQIEEAAAGTVDSVAPEDAQEKAPETTVPLVTVVDLPQQGDLPPSPPSRDVEALLAEEVYGKETQKTREEVTAPLYTGAPLVPHSSDEAGPARGEDG